MNFRNQITVLILTLNEAPNIGRSLQALSSFPEIVVLDSGSNDGTVEIVRRYKNARVVTRPFDNHAAQWNYGLMVCGRQSKWILALDADYQVPLPLADEIAGLTPSDQIFGYRARFRYLVFGRPLAGTLYPPVTLLFRRDRAQYVQEGHTQRVVIEGPVADLQNRVDHDDRKPLSRWFVSQLNYAKLEVDHLLSSPPCELSRADRIRLTGWAAPPLALGYVLIVKGCVLDGWAGWFYALQRTFVESMVAIAILDRRLRKIGAADSKWTSG